MSIATLISYANILHYPWLIPVGKTIIVLLIAYIFILFGKRIIAAFIQPILERKKRLNKSKTLTKIIVCVYNTVVGFVFLAIFLKYVLLLDISSMFTMAGIVSIAVGFASQTIIQDFVRGIILLFTESITIGDDIEVNGLRGAVEDINLHCVYLRGTDGALHVIPNSKISGYTNYTKPQE